MGQTAKNLLFKKNGGLLCPKGNAAYEDTQHENILIILTDGILWNEAQLKSPIFLLCVWYTHFEETYEAIIDHLVFKRIVDILLLSVSLCVYSTAQQQCNVVDTLH